MILPQKNSVDVVDYRLPNSGSLTASGHRRDPQRQEDLLHATVRRPDGRADGQRQIQMRGRFAEQWGHVGNLT